MNSVKYTFNNAISVFIVMEKSILYSKITVSQKNSLKTQFQILYRPFIFIVIIMSKILINV